MIDQQERTTEQIIKEENILFDKIWYNRHMCLRYQVEKGEEKVDPEIWAEALQAAKRIEDTYGKENLIFDDFEFGMLHGKLSALRWLLGWEWDLLDT